MLDQFQSVESDTRVRRPRRTMRRIVIAALSLVLLLIVGVIGYGVYLNQTVSNNITHEAMLPGQGDDPAADDADTKGQDAADIVQGPGQNFLLIGSDARPGDTFSRSDVIIIAHVTEAKDKVYLIHFPRDLYVDVPGHGKDKINAAYAYGQAPLLVQTLQNLVGVRVDHVAKIDFEGFKAMTDAVGGVRVWAEEASNGSGNGGPVVINQGWNDLNGEEALAFVRERYQLSEGDISRGRRQQAFLRALMVKSLSRETVTNPITFARFVDAATANTVVDEDFSVGDMRSQAISMRGLRGDDIVFITAPFSGFGTSPAGASIDIVDEQRMGNLADALRTDTLGDFVAQN